jgi:predicted phage tail protein
MKLINENIKGEGKGGGSAPVEGPDTLRARQTAKSLVAICEGPIEGVQNIYFNDTDIDQFADCGYDTRNGDSSQTVIPLFSNISSTVTVGLELIGPGGILYGYITSATTSSLTLQHSITLPSGKNTISVKLPNGKTETKTILTGAGTYTTISVSPFSVAPAANSAYSIKLSTSTTHPVAQDVSSLTVDEIYVNLQLDSLVAIDENGNANGYTVNFDVETRNSPTDVWEYLTTWTIKGKSTKPYSQGFSVTRPTAATGKIWGIRITRITKPDSTARINSNSRWVNTNEIIHKTLTYDNTALCGIYADAQSTGGSIPRVSLLVKGLKIKVPSNYNATTRVYTGSFNGSLTTGVYYTDNPAYCLLDLLTNDRYGMGIPLSKIDIYSFYNAGVYCDQTVSYVNESGNTINEPRFTFNNILQTYEDAYTLVQAVASCMRGFVIELGGLLTLVQDRVGSATQAFTNANVIDGVFEYNSNELSERFTTVSVTYNEPTDRYLQKVITVPHTTDHTYDTEIAKYPYNSAEIAAVGCTSAGQAYRLGKYYLDNSLMTGENIQFKTSIQHAFIQPGEIILVADSHYSGENLGGRIISATTTSITLDRSITFSGGVNTITAYLSDGTIETKIISQNLGTYTTITVPAFSSAPVANSSYIINLSTSSRPPRAFRVSKVTLMTGEEGNLLEISGSLYDSTKYTRVDSSVTMPLKQFSDIVQYQVPKPTNITRKFIQVVDSVNNISRNDIFIDWDPGDNGIYSYKIKWSYEGSDFEEVNDISATNFTIKDCAEGYYEIWLYAQNVHGALSEGVLVELTYGSSNIETSPLPLEDLNTLLSPVTNFYVKGTSGTTFSDLDLYLTWTDPNTILGTDQAITARYVIEVWNSTLTAVLNSYYVVSTLKEFTYTYSMNQKDYGTASRNVYLKIYAEDTQQKRTTAVSKTFNNPVPAAVSWTIQPDFGGVYIKITPPNGETDIKEYLIYRSTLSNFTKNDTTLIYAGPDTYINIKADSNVTYYYAVAAADTFGRVGINISGEQASMAAALEPDTFTYTGLTFKPNDPSTNSVSWTQFTVYKNGNNAVTVSAGSAAWTTGTLYLYYIPGNTTLQTNTSLLTAISAGGRVLATYKGGTDLANDSGRAFTSGDMILAGTVGANALVTNTAIITASAQIGADIKSSNYQSTSPRDGWIIKQDGTAQFEGIAIYNGDTLVLGAGNYTGTINNVASTTITTAVTNFNASNDRNSTAIVTPTIASDGTSVDHTITTSGDADISFEWAWAGNEGDIDGFRIYVYQSTSSTSYTFGTTPANEVVFEGPASKRAFILYNVSADRYYTFGIQAYRCVDKDINATGVITSSIVKPSLAAENPYRPATSVAFAGDVTGTVSGTAASTVVSTANTALSTANTANSTANTANSTANTANSTANTANSTANSALTAANSKNKTFYSTTTPTGMLTGDIWYDQTNLLLKRYNGSTWDTIGVLNNNSSGSGTPTGGIDGDSYFDTSTNLMWYKQGGVWKKVIPQLTSSNVTTFIASAAIGDAQVANLSVGKLTTGTLSSSTNITVGTSTDGLFLDGSNRFMTAVSGGSNRTKFGNLGSTYGIAGWKAGVTSPIFQLDQNGLQAKIQQASLELFGGSYHMPVVADGWYEFAGNGTTQTATVQIPVITNGCFRLAFHITGYYENAGMTASAACMRYGMNGVYFNDALFKQRDMGTTWISSDYADSSGSTTAFTTDRIDVIWDATFEVLKLQFKSRVSAPVGSTSSFSYIVWAVDNYSYPNTEY